MERIHCNTFIVGMARQGTKGYLRSILTATHAFKNMAQLALILSGNFLSWLLSLSAILLCCFWNANLTLLACTYLVKVNTLRSTHTSSGGPAAREGRETCEDTSRSGRGLRPCTPIFEWMSVKLIRGTCYTSMR